MRYKIQDTRYKIQDISPWLLDKLEFERPISSQRTLALLLGELARRSRD